MTPEISAAIARLESTNRILRSIGVLHIYAKDKEQHLADTELLIKSVKECPAAKPKLAAGAPKPRNLLLDMLATISGLKLNEVTPSMWGRIAKALKEIKTVSPDVTPEEIQRRANNYRRQWPDRDLTCTALATWWSKCGDLPRTLNGGTVRLGENVR